MKIGLHGVSTHYSNVMTDVRIARDTGYDSLEILSSKILRFLDNEGNIHELKKRISDFGLETGCVNALLSIERHKGEQKDEMLAEALRLTRVAADLNCPTVQILALNGIDDKSDTEIMDIMAQNIHEISLIGQKYGVRYQIEVVAFTKFRTLQQGLSVIERVGQPNVGMVIDFWHLYASGATPEDVAGMDKNLIYGVHFCDGRLPRKGEAWDQLAQRNYLPGEGEVDIQAWTNAVKSTGYDGLWTAELFSPKHWEDDLFEIAIQSRETMEKIIGVQNL